MPTDPYIARKNAERIRHAQAGRRHAEQAATVGGPARAENGAERTSAAAKPKVEIVTNDGGTVVARMRSDSDPNLVYTLHGSQNGKYVTCSCRGYNSHGHCKHQAALAATMQEGAFLP